MTDEVTAFLTFTLLCSAFLVVQMLRYTRRVSRLRNIVSMMSQVNDMVPQRVKAARRDG